MDGRKIRTHSEVATASLTYRPEQQMAPLGLPRSRPRPLLRLVLVPAQSRLLAASGGRFLPPARRLSPSACRYIRDQLCILIRNIYETRAIKFRRHVISVSWRLLLQRHEQISSGKDPTQST